MKIRKILACILAGLMCQCTVVFADDEEITNEDVNNMTPGWNNKDKRISDYKLTNTNDMFSLNGANSTSSDDDKDSKDDKDKDNETTFDQIIGKEDESNDSAEQAVIVYATTSTGRKNSYWGQTSDKKWMLIENGSPAVGWKYVGGNWYYMNTGGIMQTGWVNYKNKWYYLNSNGTMARNTWIGNYYLGTDGAMR